MASQKIIDEGERQDLLALYQVTTQDLAFFKSQQWTLTNYALVALAAIVGIPQLAGVQLTECSRWVLSLAAALVVIAAGWVLYRLKQSIEERRDRLERIYERLSDEFRVARGDKPRVSATEMVAFLYVLLAIGVGLAWWLLYTAGRASA